MSYLYKTPEDLLPCPHCGGEADAAPSPVDRDALLALADEIEDNDVTYSVSAQYVLDGYARRIREALGEGES